MTDSPIATAYQRDLAAPEKRDRWATLFGWECDGVVFLRKDFPTVADVRSTCCGDDYPDCLAERTRGRECSKCVADGWGGDLVTRREVEQCDQVDCPLRATLPKAKVVG